MPSSKAVRKRGWLGCQDSNLGMAVPKTAALPLGDTPITHAGGKALEPRRWEGCIAKGLRSFKTGTGQVLRRFPPLSPEDAWPGEGFPQKHARGLSPWPASAWGSARHQPRPHALGIAMTQPLPAPRAERASRAPFDQPAHFFQSSTGGLPGHRSLPALALQKMLRRGTKKRDIRLPQGLPPAFGSRLRKWAGGGLWMTFQRLKLSTDRVTNPLAGSGERC